MTICCLWRTVCEFNLNHDREKMGNNGERGAERDRKRRKLVSAARRDRSSRIAMRGVHAGEEPDDSKRWAVRRLVQVRRPARRRGRQLEVLVQWEGNGWEDSWESVTRLSSDLRFAARRMEREEYAPVHVSKRGSARAGRRAVNRQIQERERADQQWMARLRDREPCGRVKKKKVFG